MPFSSRKTILVPGSHLVDISGLIPVIDSPAFQRLRYVKQLGNLFRIFPGAVHTRFEHSLGCLFWTDKIIDRIRPDTYTCKLIRLYSLLHDIGHGPFSHEIEPLLRDSHNNRFFIRISEMKKEIESAGVSYNDFENFAVKPSPMADIVRDRNIGSDKLDYMLRDSLHIGFIGAPDPLSLIEHTLIHNGHYVIDEKAMEDIKRVQMFYAFIHKNGYLNKTSLMIERMFSRAIQELIERKPDLRDEIWNLTDSQAESLIANSDSSVSKLIFTNLTERNIFLSSIVVRPSAYVYQERIANKWIKVFGLDSDTIMRLFKNCTDLGFSRELEDHICGILQIPRGCLLIASSPHLKRLLPKDVRLYCPDTEEILSFERSDPVHYNKLNGEYYGSLCIRVGSHPEYRELVFNKSDMIMDELMKIDRV